MEARDAFRMMARSMRRTSELVANGAPDSRTLQLDGVTAAITPAAPQRSVLNGVVVEDFAKLPDQLDTIAAAYDDAGVRAWTVWVPEHERAVRELLSVRGHKLDATPAAIAATIPAARGRGLVSGLLHRALLDARERGCSTSTTQATKMGEPVYERLGYGKFGTIEMWERRE
jgi:GNAT superfamily N-acetyltransferase